MWFFGLPIIAMSGAIFVTDATYFWVGTLTAVLGVAMTPIVFTYPGGARLQLARAVSALGVLASLGLVLSGALLVGGSVGLLGERAPGWIPNASAIALTGLFVLDCAGYLLHASIRNARPSDILVRHACRGVVAGHSA